MQLENTTNKCSPWRFQFFFPQTVLMEEITHTVENSWWQLLSAIANSTIWMQMVNPLWNKKGLRWFNLALQPKNAGISCQIESHYATLHSLRSFINWTVKQPSWVPTLQQLVSCHIIFQSPWQENESGSGPLNDKHINHLTYLWGILLQTFEDKKICHSH